IKHAYDVMEADAEKQNQLDTLPSYQTFRRRINELDKERVIRNRQGKRKSEKLFQQSNDTFPHADWALQTVQIDHTPIDVRVVDEEDRLVVDRPYLTVALDVHSRVVLGYTVTYDKPSRLSIAMTLINCVDEKFKVLKKVREAFPELDVETLDMIENSEWGLVRGLPSTLHMDNGKDFVSDDIKLFGKAYKVNLHYRPVKGARYGAHVERFLGTLNKRLHNISGTTFSNVEEKGDYESDKYATYTIGELEARILSELVLYHDDYHQGIKTTPIKVWKDSFNFENPQTSQGFNIPEDLEKFKFDILPSEERTVQREGISLFGMYYNSSSLRRWIRAKDPKNKRKARKFRIRYDPRDIRSIYFYDPDQEAYIMISGKDPFMMRLFADRPFSLWEYRSINSEIVKNGLREVKSRQKQKLIASQQEMDKTAKKRTQAQRKRKSKKRSRTKKRKEDYPEKEKSSTVKITPDEEVEEVLP
ncbi:MAG: Mu transposase C-terminal domain-containing protein, partial [Candidatus Heimdallarchaeota archaeon]|nr:Mu transposase C-terminal domain-containing protein [Candidatus Heimdallarchaeota archaeon]